ncbi:MAG: helix-turn-helix transcriptional regulator [Bacilli bacterium]|nr:helix-turn-helix transcriptional regulator [Bacilli bacterium]
MSKKKEYTPLLEYDIFYVDIKSIMEERGISQNILSKITDISINTIRSYYHSNVKRVDLDVISRIVMALNCEINDVLKKK